MSQAWPIRRLEDVCVRVTDGTHQSPRFEISGIPFLVISNIVGGIIDWDNVSKWVSMRTYEENTARCRPERGDILYTAVGSFGVAVPVESDRKFMFQRHIAHIKPAPDRLYPRYLAHVLNSPGLRAAAERVAKGVAQRTVTLGDLKNFRIPVPPLAEQRRISDILDKADTIRRKRKEAIALTEELSSSAFLEIVGPSSVGYESWPVCSIESLAAKVPNAMRTGPFGSDLLHSEFVDDGIAVLGIDNAVQNRFAWGERRYITPKKYEGLRRYTVCPGDVIVTIMGTTGRSAVVPEDIPAAITTKHLATITLDRGQAEPEFISQALFRHPDVLRQIAAANRGAIMSGLNLGLIKALRLPIPPPEQQREFAIVAARIRAMAARMEGSKLEEELFNSLVAQAFSGRLAGTEEPC